MSFTSSTTWATEQTRHRRGAKSPPQSPKDKGGAEAPSQSDLRVYKSLHRGGGDLHRLQLNHKRRLPQDGPAAAQLRWTTYSGGVLHLLHRKARDIKEPCGVCDYLTRSKEAYLKLSSVVGANTNSLSVRKRSSTSPDFERLSPSGCSSSLHFQDQRA